MNRFTSLIPILALILALILVVPVTAKHSDEFLMGTYSYLKNGVTVNYANREALCRGMQKLGYNSNIIISEKNDPDLQGLLTELDKYGIDAWITDNNWSKSISSENRFASYPLSHSNYVRFEAEFSSEEDVKKGDSRDSRYWYAARSDDNFARIGKAVQDPIASYGYVWKAGKDESKQGYVFTDLRHRWVNRNGIYFRVGKEFHLYQKNPPAHEGDCIWITYRFKISNVNPGLNPEEPLLRFMTAGYEFSEAGFSSQARQVAHKYKDMTMPESLYRVKEYRGQKSGDEYVSVQVKVPYADLLAANLLSADMDGRASTPNSDTEMILINLNPRIYWFGNCDVEIDYVEMEDQLYHEMSTDKEFWRNGIVKRMQNIISQGSGNVSGFYTFDEPFHGQFEAFKLMQEMVKDAGIEIFTATFDYQTGNYTISAKDKLYYNHMEGFQKTAEPLIIAPDIYPINPATHWNPADKAENNEWFIQNTLDNKLIKVYRESKQYAMQDKNRKFYPIVQVYGMWQNVNDKDQWSNVIQPPTATQKSLLYLPLCFGPDGIIHYRLRGFQSPEGYGDYAAIYSRVGDKNYPIPEEDPTTWAAVDSSNPKVKLYGSLMRNLTWLESESIGVDKAVPSNWQKKTMLTSLRVPKQGNGAYEGFIQCGYYLDKNNLPYYMVVNRRGDFFNPGAITQERYVSPIDFNKYFTEADSQTLNMEFIKKATKQFGKAPALYDPADNSIFLMSDNKLSINLPAGEGRLLQLTGSLPAKVKGTNKLNKKTVIGGTIELQKGAKVVIGKNGELVLLPGSHLVVPNKCTLQILGTVTLLGDAKISVAGKLKNKAKKINSAPEARFEVQGTLLYVR